MKTYIKPSTSIVVIETVHMIAASGDSKSMSISNDAIDNVTFGSRRSDGLWDDEE